ncbi:MAG TPA: glycosyltransferase family 1 protein [Acidobacteriaceae bacterium]|nr:glycosyltransferase family 1 protein [Acidobacteriaceae bacterium]
MLLSLTLITIDSHHSNRVTINPVTPAGGVLNEVHSQLKIALISNYRRERSYSMLAYSAMLAEGLRRLGHEAKIVYPPAILGRLPVGKGEFAKWVGYIDKYLIAPLYLRWKIRKADIVHVCDHSNSMYLRCAGKIPNLITCHDLIAINSARGIYPGVSVRWSGRLQQRWIARGLARARHVVCVSGKTKADFRAYFPNSKAELDVIYNALSREFKRASRDEVRKPLAALKVQPDTKFLLHVGGNSWYKNRLAAICIFKALRRFPEFQDFILILAGRPRTEETRRFCQLAKIEHYIVEAVNIPDATLNALYSGAQALIFPSREEGFGWPILEAQACGCAVITTNRAPMTEVAGGAAILIDPSQPELAAQTIREQWPRRELLCEQGSKNLERFSLKGIIDAYSAVYEAIVHGSSISEISENVPLSGVHENR